MSDSPIDRRWLPLTHCGHSRALPNMAASRRLPNALLISQSALSRHVIALEKLLGSSSLSAVHSLSADQGRSIPATGDHEVLSTAWNMRSMICATRVRRRHDLRVQMPPSFAVQLAVPILRDFRRTSAEVDIDLVQSPRRWTAAF